MATYTHLHVNIFNMIQLYLSIFRYFLPILILYVVVTVSVTALVILIDSNWKSKSAFYGQIFDSLWSFLSSVYSSQAPQWTDMPVYVILSSIF